MATESEWIVSVDDHLLEPPNLWVDRLPRKYSRYRASSRNEWRPRGLGVRG